MENENLTFCQEYNFPVNSSFWSKLLFYKKSIYCSHTNSCIMNLIIKTMKSFFKGLTLSGIIKFLYFLIKSSTKYLSIT